MAEARAVRLILEYEGDEVRLVSQQPVNVAVRSSGAAPVPAGDMAVETRTADGITVDRVRVLVPVPHSVEVFPEEVAGRIERVDVERPTGAFTVILPVAQSARTIAVLRGGPVMSQRGVGPADEARVVPGAAEVLATFDLETGERSPGEASS